MINFIVAMDENKLIGINNKLPWHIPEDLNYFKNMTTKKVIIMGLNTFKSIGLNPLKNRLNIVLTSSPEKYKNTLELLGLWEKLHNPDFKLVEFDQFKNEAG